MEILFCTCFDVRSWDIVARRYLFGQNMLLLFCLCLLSYVSAICYYPNGFTGTSRHAMLDVDSGGNTFCCGQGYACLSNTVCMSYQRQMIRILLPPMFAGAVSIRNGCLRAVLSFVLILDTVLTFISSHCALIC